MYEKKKKNVLLHFLASTGELNLMGLFMVRCCSLPSFDALHFILFLFNKNLFFMRKVNEVVVGRRGKGKSVTKSGKVFLYDMTFCFLPRNEYHYLERGLEPFFN